ncbi:hypothetical protein HS041_05935 [Planomonospora sp. ID67723]|uniref:hypothetical protein n=1 Tax=Planomonospora sp. ID67723 TaxID=2738134 RepID=UPI0018C37EC1|nr:hypothetical protein [Planomonospora sp. ID67723]MBG0827300.1 hypothetical protein [Planomonospora sp. ID67723]
MGMSRQATFTLACVTLLSGIVPGCAGYLSARMDALDEAHRRLSALEDRLHETHLATRAQLAVTPVPMPCEISPRPRPTPPLTELVSTAAGARERETRAADRERRRRIRDELVASVREPIRGTVVREHEIRGTVAGEHEGRADRVRRPPGRPLAEISGEFRRSGGTLG